VNFSRPFAVSLNLLLSALLTGTPISACPAFASRSANFANFHQRRSAAPWGRGWVLLSLSRNRLFVTGDLQHDRVFLHMGREAEERLKRG
jgi:hypothetical protein